MKHIKRYGVHGFHRRKMSLNYALGLLMYSCKLVL